MALGAIDLGFQNLCRGEAAVDARSHGQPRCANGDCRPILQATLAADFALRHPIADRDCRRGAVAPGRRQAPGTLRDSRGPGSTTTHAPATAGSSDRRRRESSDTRCDSRRDVDWRRRRLSTLDLAAWRCRGARHGNCEEMAMVAWLATARSDKRLRDLSSIQTHMMSKGRVTASRRQVTAHDRL